MTAMLGSIPQSPPKHNVSTSNSCSFESPQTDVRQGCLMPCFAVLSSNWIPRQERGLHNTLVMSGFAVGSAVWSYLSGLICESSVVGGWPSTFYIFGSFQMLFGLWVQICLFESPSLHPRIKTAELNYILGNQETDLPQKRPPTPWGKILTSVPVYVGILAIFAHYWMAVQVISLYAPFSAQVLRFSLKESGLYTSISFVFATVFSVAASTIPSWLNKKGAVGVQKSRKGCSLIATIGYSAGMLGICFAGCNRKLINYFSIIALGFFGFGFGGALITPMDLSPMFAGAVISLSTVVGSSSSFLFPVIVGVMTNKDQSIEQWYKIFYLSVGITVISAVVYCLFGSTEVQPWNYPKGFEKKSVAEKSNEQTSKNAKSENTIESITRF